MRAARLAMTSPGRFRTAEKGLALGRPLGGRSGRITALPWPASRWTATRDVPVPPAETARDWFSRTRPGRER